MQPSRARLAGWTRSRIRAKEQHSARTRLAQRPADRLTPLDRARALLRDRLSLHLMADEEQPDAPDRTRLHGLWWLPVVGTAADRQSLRTLADVWTCEPRRVDAAAVRTLEADAADTAVAVLVSEHGFRRAGIQRALHSEVPFLLLHLPTDDRKLPDAGPVSRTVKVDSALDLDYACGAFVANATLNELLGGRLQIGWDRIADEPEAMGAGETEQSEGRRTVLKFLSTRSVPTLYWAGMRLPDVDTAKKSASFAKRLEERQKALRRQQEQAEASQQEADGLVDEHDSRSG
ncbi:hypothetical protein AURDEDRAFT_112833 [Auricularia subglabra TFB-10046 SS5]|nr:hypothetical protein AURDEDRAFT_112833 [Auricularia subglabra TFB-10046 SS5]